MIIIPNIAGKKLLEIKSQGIWGGANSALPAHAPGDLILALAASNNGGGAPGKPSDGVAWTTVRMQEPQVGSGSSIFYAVATSSSHTSGSWSSNVYFIVLTGQAASPIGGQGGASSTPYYASGEGYYMNGGYMPTVNQTGTSKIFYVCAGYGAPFAAGTQNTAGFTVVYTSGPSASFNHSIVVMSRNVTTDVDVYANSLRPFSNYFYGSASGVEILSG